MIYNRNKSLDLIKEEDDLKKTRVSKTAQVNLMMLADLGIEEPSLVFLPKPGFIRCIW